MLRAKRSEPEPPVVPVGVRESVGRHKSQVYSPLPLLVAHYKHRLICLIEVDDDSLLCVASAHYEERSAVGKNANIDTDNIPFVKEAHVRSAARLDFPSGGGGSGRVDEFELRRADHLWWGCLDGALGRQSTTEVNPLRMRRVFRRGY